MTCLLICLALHLAYIAAAAAIGAAIFWGVILWGVINGDAL